MGYLLKSVGVLSMTVLLAGVAMAEEKDPLKPARSAGSDGRRQGHEESSGFVTGEYCQGEGIVRGEGHLL